MKGKSLIVAVFIVLSSFVSFLIWQAGEEMQFDVDYYGYFKTQDDLLVVQYGQRLLWISNENKVTQQLDLNHLNLNALGDYDFFSNGDLLIYHRNKALTFSEKIKQYLRLSKTTEINHSQMMGDDGFYRCQIGLNTCAPFGLALPKLDRSFRIVIDRHTDMLYLSDTSAHQIYKIDKQGLIRSEAGGFKFPNQLLLHKDSLWVSDTNHHRLVELETGDNHFGEIVNQLSTELSTKHRWPHQFSFQEDSLWVNVANNNMSDGKIVKFDLSGKQTFSAEANFLTDPVALIIWQDKLLVTDFESAIIEQFTQRGESLGLLTIPELSTYLSIRAKQIEKGVRLSQAGTALFILTFIIGLVCAWILERKESLALFTPSTSAAYGPTEVVITKARERFQNNSKPSSIFWLDNQILKHKKRHRFLVVVLFIITVILSWFCFQFIELIQWNTIALAIGWLPLIIGYHYLVKYISAIKLGVQGNTLVSLVKGKTITTDFSKIFYHPLYLCHANFVIPLGNKKQNVFDNEQLDEYVYSQLQVENKLSSILLLKYLWQQREPLFLSYSGLFICILGVLIWDFIA